MPGSGVIVGQRLQIAVLNPETLRRRAQPVEPLQARQPGYHRSHRASTGKLAIPLSSSRRSRLAMVLIFPRRVWAWRVLLQAIVAACLCASNGISQKYDRIRRRPRSQIQERCLLPRGALRAVPDAAPDSCRSIVALRPPPPLCSRYGLHHAPYAGREAAPHAVFGEAISLTLAAKLESDWHPRQVPGLILVFGH